jgi:S-adenosylmethionine decarboxylase
MRERRNGNPHAQSATEAVGEHLLADLYGVRVDRLTDEAALTALLREALEAAGFRILGSLGHTFPGKPSGVTSMLLLAESHASIHTYPERGYAAVDIFSCGRGRPGEALEALLAALEPREVQTVRQPRGGAAGHLHPDRTTPEE